MHPFFMFFRLIFLCSLFIFSACEDRSHTLTIYTSLPDRDTQVILEAFEKKYPDIKVSFFRSGTNEVVSKLRVEFMAENPKADVILLADDVTMTFLKQEGRLQPLPQVDTTHLLQDTFDQDKTFFGIALIGTGLVCHLDSPPSSTRLQALASEEMKGKIVMPSPIFSGSGAINLSLIAENFGWSYWEDFMRNNPLFVKGNGAVLDTVLKKGRGCGVLVDFMALNAIKDGASLSFHYFDEGTPMIHEPVAVLKNTRHFDHALLFVQFILSMEGQNLLRQLGYRSIRDDVPLPKIFENFDMSTCRVMPMDLLKILERIEKDRENFSKFMH